MDEPERRIYVAALCAVTRSHLGAVMVEHLQAEATRRGWVVELDAYPDAVPFYEALGFQAIGDEGNMEWQSSQPPTKKAKKK